MSGIRMIDRFIGNVRLCGDTIEDDEFAYVTLCGTPHHESQIDGEYIVHAINNHDQLVEENVQLKADKTELIAFVESVANCHAIIGIGGEDVSDKGRARKLLNKHKGKQTKLLGKVKGVVQSILLN